MSRSVPLLHRFEDPETSRDPRVRAVVEALADLDYAPAPRVEFRAELREQLVAIAARVLDESAAEAAAEGASASQPRPVAEGDRPRRRFVRPLGVATACVAVLAVGFGGAVWKSRSALPGDSLYGLKRASENVQLSLTSGDTDRGDRYLHLATTRADEARALVGHDAALGAGSGVLAAGVSAHTVSLIRSTLKSANSDVKHGARLLGAQAFASHSAQPLSVMTAWAPHQLDRLRHLAAAVDDPAAQASAAYSVTLVQGALQWANKLSLPRALSCNTKRSSAPYGPAPCPSSSSTTPTVVPSTPVSSSSPVLTKPASTRSRSHSAAPTHGRNKPTTTAQPRSGASSTHSGGAATSPDPTPTLPLPSLPKVSPTRHHPGTKKHTAPVAVNSCGVSASVGPIGVRIGVCPSGH